MELRWKCTESKWYVSPQPGPEAELFEYRLHPLVRATEVYHAWLLIISTDVAEWPTKFHKLVPLHPSPSHCDTVVPVLYPFGAIEPAVMPLITCAAFIRP